MTIKEAIKHLGTYSSTLGSGQTSQEQHEEAKRVAIENLEKTRWIPVAERLPENATNGDMVMAMFTKGKVRREVSCTHDKTVFSFPDGTYFGAECRFNTDWWNKPYKEVSE